MPFLPPNRPVTKMMLVFVAAILASFVVAATRPISPDELRSSQQGLIGLAGWLGVVLMAGDGIVSRERLETLLTRLAWLAGLISLLAIVQFLTRQTLVDKIQIPGLSPIHDIRSGAAQRGGLARPSGTAIHPIEFGIVLTTCLPFALHLAVHGRQRAKAFRFLPALLIVMVVPISISRSTILCALLVFAILLPTWPRLWRRLTLAVIGAGAVALYAASPGLVGTLTSLFTGISGDSSALSRTDSYGLAFQFVSTWPVFGRGFLTFLPQYRILDNQYLGLLIDTGVVGLGAFLATISSAILACLKARRRLTDPSERHLALACMASVCAGALGFALFDAMSFPMAAGIFFLALGCAGAVYRLSLSDQLAHPRQSPSPHQLASELVPILRSE